MAVDRNKWSRLLIGRDRGDAVQRGGGRQWLRWWGFGGAFLAVSIFVPISVANTYEFDQRLRELGTPRAVEVVEVDSNNAGATFTVQLDARQVELSNPDLTPTIGSEVQVIVGPDGRVVLADDVGAKDAALGDAAFGVFVALFFFIGLGWGPGLAPYRALRAIRKPENVEQSTIVTLDDVALEPPPQGRVYAAWRRGTGQFYDLALILPTKRVIRWRGRGPRGLEDGMKARMVGGGFEGDWVALVVNVRDSTDEFVCWPVTRVSDPAPDPGVDLGKR